jgi:hypothetical protein
MYQQYPVPTLLARGPKRGREQLERIRRVLKKYKIETYKRSAQTEQKRGVPGQIDRMLLKNIISSRTVSDLEAELGNTTLKLQTWPNMPP